ncbi:MAG: ATP-binding protein [Draconibacterium sp.]|nr:MAG: ATP-binding protein [Draconibacterium sp.]
MLSTYLHKLISEGEHQQQDFKFCINDSKKIAKSLVAFANTDGGRLLIGVKDNGRITGIRTDEEYYMVESAAKIYSDPPIPFTTRQWQADGKTVLEVKVESSNEKPHFARDENGKWLAYLRVGDENMLAHKIQINVWRKQRSPSGIMVPYTANEKLLIEILKKNELISFSKYLRLAGISRKKAEIILTNFVLMDVVTIHTSQNGTRFSLNQNFNEKDNI